MGENRILFFTKITDAASLAHKCEGIWVSTYKLLVLERFDWFILCLKFLDIISLTISHPLSLLK
jgi:hypothetical protein